jgi:hypothetical protein
MLFGKKRSPIPVLAIWDIGSQNQGFSEKQEGSKSSGVALF